MAPPSTHSPEVRAKAGAEWQAAIAARDKPACEALVAKYGVSRKRLQDWAYRAREQAKKAAPPVPSGPVTPEMIKAWPRAGNRFIDVPQDVKEKVVAALEATVAAGGVTSEMAAKGWGISWPTFAKWRRLAGRRADKAAASPIKWRKDKPAKSRRGTSDLVAVTNGALARLSGHAPAGLPATAAKLVGECLRRLRDLGIEISSITVKDGQAEIDYKIKESIAL